VTFRAIKAGVQGYLLKNLEASQLRSMLEGVARGERRGCRVRELAAG
jgi:DNA-binding NarL/FixJ family response regulator